MLYIMRLVRNLGHRQRLTRATFDVMIWTSMPPLVTPGAAQQCRWISILLSKLSFPCDLRQGSLSFTFSCARICRTMTQMKRLLGSCAIMCSRMGRRPIKTFQDRYLISLPSKLRRERLGACGALQGVGIRNSRPATYLTHEYSQGTISVS